MDPASEQVVINQSAIFLTKSQQFTWKHELLLPTYASALSATLLAFQVILSSRPFQTLLSHLFTSQKKVEFEPEEGRCHGFIEDIRAQARSEGGPTILFFKMLRLLGCLALASLNFAALITVESNHENILLKLLKHKIKKEDLISTLSGFTKEEWLQVTLCLSYIYTSFLAVSSVGTHHCLGRIANVHLVSVLLTIWGVFAYRDLWPLATYHLQPSDQADKLLWAKISVLTITAVFVPLSIPRQYVPVDPERKPEESANPETTASLLSLILYGFLDPVIFKAYRIPYLPASQFPPLADYDHAKQLRNRSFSYIDSFSGASNSNRNLFFSLLKVFRYEYIGIALMSIIKALTMYASPIGINRLLRHLETEGADATIRPWFWISWLFIGPFVGAIAFQWYNFLATGTLVRTESIITQLIFEHALRIRMKAQTVSNTVFESSTAAITPDSISVVGSGGRTEGMTVDSSDIQTNQTNSATLKSTSRKDKGKISASSLKYAAQNAEDTSDSENIIGKLNNLITTDLQSIVEGRDFCMLIVQSPLLVGFGICMLYNLLGWSAFVGMVVMVLLFPIPGYIAKITQKVQKERMKRTDARVQTVTETMNIIRMVKLFGWEPSMKNRIAKKRENELTWIRYRQFLDIANGLINFLIPILTMIVTYTVYTLIMKQQLTASVVFSSMAVFDMLRDQLHHIFFLIPVCIQGKVSLDRVSEFLRNTELLDSFQVFGEHSAGQTEDSTTVLEDPNAIGFSDASFVWSSIDDRLDPPYKKFCLTFDKEVIFKRGRLNLVIGPTGCGKTSLLMALLGEMHFFPSGPTAWYNLPRDKGVAYAAQESWLQNETIRDNILLGSHYDEVRYKKVIYQCGLDRDLALFDAGDQTEVGEKGLTLSGGQKARITLARAIYSTAEIILLDDILAALDVHTSRWIVDKCLQGDIVRGRTIILVTNNVAIVSPIASHVVSLGIDGRVESQGPVAETMIVDNEMKVKSEDLEEVQKEVDQREWEETEGRETRKSDGKLIIAEEIGEDHVSWSAVKLYLFNLGDALFWFSFLFAFFLADFTNVMQTRYLGYWASQYEEHDSNEVSAAYHLAVFSSILLFGIVCYALGYATYVYGSIKASRKIHEKLIASIMGTTLRWLDSTPSGRIITRCTQDISSVDGPIQQNLSWVVELTIMLLIRIAAIVFASPAFVIPGVIVGVIGSWLGQVYIKAQLSVKREMSNAKAPVMSHLGAAMTGLVSIRAFGAQDAFKTETLSRIDRYTRSARTFYNLNRWVCVRIDTLGAMFSSGLAAYLVYGHQLKSASAIGFSLNMAVSFSSMILWWVTNLNSFEVSGNSLERIQAYIDIDREPESSIKGIPPAYWPSSGNLTVEKLSARYAPEGPEVLRDLSFDIKSGERVGVVGRTGSGKSSLTLALLRCILTDGRVLYDGLSTSEINLDILRRNITIIPQVPELLSGSIRHNLDPFEEKDDAALNSSLRAAGLFSLQSDGDEGAITLDSQVSSGGSNLSIGQRQILALARAIVRGSKLLILDEATSAIDYATDSVIQSSLRNELSGDITLITIAHRLQTIMDSDKIMVLDAGRLVEFDSPRNLLKKEDSLFKSLVDESGDSETLYIMANGA